MNEHEGTDEESARDEAQQRVDDIRNEDQQQANDALDNAQPPSH